MAPDGGDNPRCTDFILSVVGTPWYRELRIVVSWCSTRRSCKVAIIECLSIFIPGTIVPVDGGSNLYNMRHRSCNASHHISQTLRMIGFIPILEHLNLLLRHPMLLLQLIVELVGIPLLEEVSEHTFRNL